MKLLVALLVASAGIAGTLLIEQESLPDEWKIPAPQVGDKAAYHVTRTNNSEYVNITDYRVERGQPEWVYMQDGTPVLGYPTTDTWIQDNGHLISHFTDTRYDNEDGFLLRDYKWRDGMEHGIHSRFFTAQLPLFDNSVPAQHFQDFATSYEEIGFCGIHSLLYMGIMELGACDAEPIAKTTWNGEEALVFEGEGFLTTYQVWYTKSVPFPVQMIRYIPDGPGYDTFTLASFTPGMTEVIVPQRPADLPLPRLTDTDKGMPQGELDMPFTLQEAIEAAESHGNTIIANFDWTHISSARSQTVIDSDYNTHSWTITFANQQTAHTVKVTWEEPTDENDLPYDIFDLRFYLEGEYYLEVIEENVEPQPATPLPSLNEAAETWRTWKGTEPTHYGFHNGNLTIGQYTMGNDLNRMGYLSSGLVAEDTSFYFETELLRLSDQIERTERRTQAYRDEAPGITGSLENQPEPPQEATSNAAPSAPVIATAVAVGGIAGALVYLLPLLKSWIAGFSRIKDDALLQHPLRQNIMQLVEAQPGVHLAGIMQTLDIPQGTANHHIQKMMAGNLLRAQGIGRIQGYYKPGKITPAEAQARAALNGPTTQIVFQHANGATVAELVAATGKSQGTVSYQIKRLEEAGLITRHREGRTTRIQWTELAEKLPMRL